MMNDEFVITHSFFNIQVCMLWKKLI